MCYIRGQFKYSQTPITYFFKANYINGELDNMKKQGFTLAEALITVGIIGVVAALILPAVNNLRPDQNKVLYLKAHDALGYALHNLASNSKLFPAYIEEEQIPCASYPLLNTEAPIEERFEDYTGRTKLCNLLALSMNVNSDNITCSGNSYNFSQATFDNDFNNNISFTTQNSMQWRVVPQALAIADGNAEYQTDIYVDVNGNKAPNCIYNANSCTDPDRFMFLVDAKGTLYPADPMGRAHLAHRKVLTKKNFDIDGEFLASLDDIKVDLRDFYIDPDDDEEQQDELPNYDFITLDSDDNYTGSQYCKTSAMVDGIPVVRNDGYVHNLRTTFVKGVYSEVYNSTAGNCHNYSRQRHYMWNPETQRFEELVNVDSVSADAAELKGNEVYERLKNKISTTNPPTIKWNGGTYKIPVSQGNNWADVNPYSYHSTIQVPQKK